MKRYNEFRDMYTNGLVGETLVLFVSMAFRMIL